MGVYSCSPKTPQDFLEFLGMCVERYMQDQNEMFEELEELDVKDDELISCSTDFASGEYGVGMLVGPFRDAEKNLWSFVVDIGGIKVLT